MPTLMIRCRCVHSGNVLGNIGSLPLSLIAMSAQRHDRGGFVDLKSEPEVELCP